MLRKEYFALKGSPGFPPQPLRRAASDIDQLVLFNFLRLVARVARKEHVRAHTQQQHSENHSRLDIHNSSESMGFVFPLAPVLRGEG